MSKGLTRKGLGRGLGALLSDNDNENANLDNNHTDSITSDINISDIVLNPFQPRTNFEEEALEELANSIRTQGIIQPITVRDIGNGKYQIISGERRFQASKKIGNKQIPAYIREATDQQMLEMALIENIQRENLNAIEVAISYQRLMDECHLNQEELSERVGKKRSTIANFLRLLKLPNELKNGLIEKKISMGHARALLGIENESQLISAYNTVIKEDLSVRQTEELVKKINEGKTVTKVKTDKTPKEKIVLEDIEKILSDFFDKKVSVISDNEFKGEIKINFKNREEMDQIIESLKK